MSSKFRWLALYGFILLCAFAFGVGYGMAYEEAWANQPCDCTYTCYGEGIAGGKLDGYHICRPCPDVVPCCVCDVP